MRLRTNPRIIGIGTGGGRVGGRTNRTETTSRQARITKDSRTIRISLTSSLGGRANLSRKMARSIHQWFNQSSRSMRTPFSSSLSKTTKL